MIALVDEKHVVGDLGARGMVTRRTTEAAQRVVGNIIRNKFSNPKKQLQAKDTRPRQLNSSASQTDYKFEYFHAIAATLPIGKQICWLFSFGSLFAVCLQTRRERARALDVEPAFGGKILGDVPILPQLAVPAVASRDSLFL